VSRRFGAICYRNEELLAEMREVSGLHEKSAVIQKELFAGEDYDAEPVEIEVNALYEDLVCGFQKERAQVLFRSARALGTALGRLAHDRDYAESYSRRKSDGKCLWMIKPVETGMPSRRRRNKRRPGERTVTPNDPESLKSHFA
jgi:hypothetical protein